MSALPYIIKTNDLFGRYLIAARDIKEGEIVLKEAPLLVGPLINASHVCFKCNSKIYHDHVTCNSCTSALLCSNDCNGTFHSELECDALKTLRLKKYDVFENPQIIFPLRCFLLKKYDGNKWEQFINMETHLESRRNTPIWRSHKLYVEQIMQKLNALSEDDLKDEVMQKICGILDVNSFELRPKENGQPIDPSDSLRGIFVQAALMAHDCTPNVHLAVDDENTMTIHASLAIKEGETIFFNYSNGLQGNHSRQKHLKEGKYFKCSCKRCSDPTELGTHLSSIRCPRCKKGLVSPKSPLENIYNTPWQCNGCPCTFEGPMLRSTISECKRLISNIGPLQVTEGENVLKKLLRTLAPSHYLILELKQHLIGMYNEIEPNTRSIARKIELCKDFLPVLSVVEPGISRLTAIALYELHSSELSLANKEYNSKKITTDQFLTRLSNCEEKLKQALKYLLYEPAKSPEGRLAKRAMTELQVLRNTMKQIKRILAVSNPTEITGKLVNG